jgi:ATP-dependent protease ClpP protease subunit
MSVKLWLMAALNSLILMGCAIGTSFKSSYDLYRGKPNQIAYGFDIKSENNVNPFANGVLTVGDADGVCWIFIRGVITPDAVRAFRLASEDVDRRNCLKRQVILDSRGGHVFASIQIGRIIRARGYTTQLVVGTDACHSACGIIFIGGVKRIVNESSFIGSARIGFHQITAVRSDGSKRCVSREDGATKTLQVYAREMLMPAAADLFMEMVESTECTKMKTISPQETFDSGIATEITNRENPFL